VQKVLPVLLFGLDDNLVELACLWVLSYKLRHRKGPPPDITEDNLQAMKSSLKRCAHCKLCASMPICCWRQHDNLTVWHCVVNIAGCTPRCTVLPLMPSEGQTIQYRKLMYHSVSNIQLLGALPNLSSQFFEAAHLSPKQLYRSSSKRLKNDQYLKGMLQRMASHDAADKVQSQQLAAQQQDSVVVRTGQRRQPAAW
jgi:hypothetical protein